MLNQLVAFTLNGQAYALSLARVRQVLRMVEITPLPQAPDIVLGVVSLHGTVIPVFSLRKRLGLLEGGTNLSDHLIVADTEGTSVALVVDAVNGVLERSTEEITVVETIVPGADYVAGIAKLENGMLFIHNLDRFLSRPEQSQLHGALAMARGAE
jgi:purine-binding chemotaxis protein CheW